jgi:DNA repair protein RecN (Recombination protein N)
MDRGRDELGSAIAELRKAASLDPSLVPALEELHAIEGRIGDVVMAVSSASQDLDIEPQELEEAEQRLNALNELRRKYGPTLGDVLEFGARAAQRATELDDLLERADSLAQLIAAARSELASAGTALRDARVTAARQMSSQAVAHLVELGFSDPSVEVAVADAEPGPAGADGVTLLFASDRRLRAGEISKVASGGELSRLVLALRLAGGAGDAETLVFDEIDAGVGGATALAVGRKLAALAADRQVLCVTHLPQVAAFADLHIVVRREGDTAGVAVVDGQERLEELSRMLAGLPDSERGREAAEELITIARSSPAG